MDGAAFTGRTGRIEIGEQQASAVVLGTEGAGKEDCAALSVSSALGMASFKANHTVIIVHVHVIGSYSTTITL